MCAVNSAAFLASVWAACGNCHQKGSQGHAYFCWMCMLRRQVRAPPLATLYSGTGLSLDIPVLHIDGKRQKGGRVGVGRLISSRLIHAGSGFLNCSVTFVSLNEVHWSHRRTIPCLYKGAKALIHPWEGLTAVCSWRCYQLIPVIMGALQTNSWKPIKATYYVITSPLSPETPL